jgi:glycyl-tRNA synthetase beta chain
MPEFFLELFGEEIPARMQARGAEDLSRLIGEALVGLRPQAMRTFFGPRRIALAAEIAPAVPESRISERGPRANAPEQALAGFLRKHGATREELRQDGDYWVLERTSPAITAARLIAEVMPALLRRFPWPKSMRWGGSSSFTWVRPLRRILCLLDGSVVPFDLRDGADDGHGLAAAELTEGHRFLAPGAVAVSSRQDWETTLRARRVIVEAAERRRIIADGVARLAEERQLRVVEDGALLDEVAGLTEWPVPLFGQIDDAYMDLPPEVMQVSMRVNQRYFALRDAAGNAAPFFAFAANVEAEDGGAAIIAGNERVLRARFSDARHFWDLDRKTKLADRAPALDAVTFHAKLGSQGDRARRLQLLARVIAPDFGCAPEQAETAALLAKADLTSGMVGEFPELQGVMGRYYALHDGVEPAIADAVRDHYVPRGAADPLPEGALGQMVGLADRIDQLVGFFAIGERPSGSGDPYALRRAAISVVRLLRGSGARIRLRTLGRTAAEILRRRIEIAEDDAALAEAVLDFIVDRMRVQLRAEGGRHDVLAAVFAVRDEQGAAEDDLVRLAARSDAVAQFLATPEGTDLLAGYRRAANILRIESRKDGPYDGFVNATLLQAPEEQALAATLDDVGQRLAMALPAEDFAAAMEALAGLRGPVDRFFDKVTVNAEQAEIRRNRLHLLARVRAVMDRVADFSKIEG